MSLGSGEWLLGDGQGMSDTYCLILTTHILVPFQLAVMDVGSSGAGICNDTTDPGIDEMGT